ncbi:ubiquitin c-terminal hydrolase family protein [Rutstroemia sp. NJR-2017a WRK4]|nr:ubiquitin c-terminal hydrolase family protein [Rutstroemia sp. NJR-2017a WRK4]PQE11884.1 ubiquitin c-terminal hydrolase family protein [Rutstroemia sp. NJR-2017a WRK4]
MLAEQGRTEIEDEQITYALNSSYAMGDVNKALELVIIFRDSVEGVVKPYDPKIKMLGAVNNGGVTCYLDSLLFAMFARLPSFEPLLHSVWEDEPRRRLATLIRLWVNMLRSGMLIQKDITEHLQKAIETACDWEEVTNGKQQDTTEAFNKIADALGLPLLTLKMNIMHPGIEVPKDDHKYVYERLLDVAIPDDLDIPTLPDGSKRPIRLEDCLEAHFNNRVEVHRRLKRSATTSSTRSNQSSYEKSTAQHVEVAEVTPSAPQTPSATGLDGAAKSRPDGRTRSSSVFRNKVITPEEHGESSRDPTGLSRSMSRVSVYKSQAEREVMLPAWQCFNLLRPSPFLCQFKPHAPSTKSETYVLIANIAWFTKSEAKNDQQVAAHLLKTRPVLGIALKRYTYTATGDAIRKNTFVDIPLDIKLPHFLEEDMIREDGPLMGNFKLSLQSFICHRGYTPHSGHYICFVRGTTRVPDGDSDSSEPNHSSHPPGYAEDRWIKFDDVGSPRVSEVTNIQHALKEEMPYLLFYQVQPTYDTYLPHDLQDLDGLPPSYSDSGVDVTISESSPALSNSQNSTQGYFDGAIESTPTIRYSMDEQPRRSLNLPDSERRASLAVTDGSTASIASLGKSEAGSAPVTPNEEASSGRASRTLRRNKGGRSRPPSSSNDGRFAQAIKGMISRASKENLPADGSSVTTITKEAAAVLENTTGIANNNGEPIKQNNGTISRKGSKKSKKRTQSRGPAELENPELTENSPNETGKEKDQERVCKIM